MPEPATLDQWLEFISSVHPKDMALGLDRVAGVAAELEVTVPAPCVVTIAGTNGKGSTTAALEAILQAVGLHTGATYSPHLSRFNERIRMGGREATDAEICTAFSAVDAARGQTPLTYFEYAALAALYLFSRERVDVALLEIGLGGRLDAFNLVDADVAIVTSIGLDHQDYLGNDLEDIGREKAGIFRHARPVVLGAVTESVQQVAKELQCTRHRLGVEFSVDRAGNSWSYLCAACSGDLGAVDADDGTHLANLPLGSLAPANGALALTGARLALRYLKRTAPMEDMAAALSSVHLTGRMEEVEFNGVPVVLDVAHNPAAADFLAAELRARWPERRFVAIYGALGDKDARGVMSAMGALVSHWLLIPSFGWRGQSAQALAGQVGLDSVAGACDSVAGALDQALSLTESGDGIVVFGSFSAVEQARELLIAPRQQTIGGGRNGRLDSRSGHCSASWTDDSSDDSSGG